jgi:hypothetical protein
MLCLIPMNERTFSARWKHTHSAMDSTQARF